MSFKKFSAAQSHSGNATTVTPKHVVPPAQPAKQAVPKPDATTQSQKS